MLLGLTSTVWLTRAVGPSYFGYYAVMVTIVTLGGLLVNAGLSTAGSQRVANDPSKAGEVLWVVTVSRALIAAFFILGGLVVLAIVPMDAILRDYLRVGLVVWAIIPLRSEWALVAQGRLRALSGLRVAGAAATLLTVILLVRDVSDADRVAWIPVVGAIVSGAGSTLLAQRWSQFRRPVGIAIAASIRAYMHDALNYLKSDVSVFIFTSSDRLFLYAFATPAVVGLYEAAYRVLQPFYMISAVVADAMYLRLARAMQTGQLGPTVRRFVDLMCFATIPLGFFLLAFSSSVILILYGSSYAGASEYLAILGWVITFGYTSGVAVMPFSAWNRAREYGNATGFGGALNLGLNVALIPPFKGFGAAWATVAAKIAVTLIGIRYFRRATDYPLVRDFAEYFAVSAAALAVAVPATWFLPYPTASGIGSFGLVYVGLVAAIRWRHYGRLSAGTLRSLLPGGSDVNKRAGS
jgi:O-antigen/teichoic acid export membrane protein